jgi:hypothetical protein
LNAAAKKSIWNASERLCNANVAKRLHHFILRNALVVVFSRLFQPSFFRANGVFRHNASATKAYYTICPIREKVSSFLNFFYAQIGNHFRVFFFGKRNLSRRHNGSRTRRNACA